MVKVDLGVHIDGFIAVVAHTVLVPAAADSADQALSAADLQVSIDSPLP